jgi:ABC-type multidrug transport system ATPase subunit/ABC-type transporter Mla maintaining outer membrane lipid asymmetry permease subunit MlaE
MTAVVVSIRSLTVHAGHRELLREVSIDILPGKITFIVGGSGAGKSVLLRILGGLVGPRDASIRYTGLITIGEPAAAARVGIVFQSFALFDQWSPGDNVRFAIDHRGDSSSPAEQSAAAWLEELRVPSATAVSVLSGGQKQRLAIARTLAAAPAVVLYDEPTSGLDAASGRQVAELIRRTQQTHRRTSIVVTHDYATLLGIADDVLLFDSAGKTLTRVPREHWDTIEDRIIPVRRSEPATGEAEAENGSDETTGRSTALSALATRIRDRAAAEIARVDSSLQRTGARLAALFCQLRGRGDATGRGRFRHARLRPWWIVRFFLTYLRLVCGPSAMVYLAVAGTILGFTATYFTFEFLPYRIYSKPLLIEDLLASIGFALYRILVPVLATILVAARCGAAVAADVGVRRYGAQLDALRTLGVSPLVYLFLPILFAFLIATPLLGALAFQVARLVSLVCFHSMHDELGPHFWSQHFHSRLAGGWVDSGGWWVIAKTAVCGVGVAMISYHQGNLSKGSAGDVSDSITATVLWATLFVLVVHFVTSFYEF